MDRKCFNIHFKNFSKPIYIVCTECSCKCLCKLITRRYLRNTFTMKYIHNEIPIQLEVYVMGLLPIYVVILKILHETTMHYPII